MERRHDEHRRRADLTKRREQVETAPIGKADIQHNGAKRAFPGKNFALRDGSGGERGQSALVQVDRQQLPDGAVVIDDQDGRKAIAATSYMAGLVDVAAVRAVIPNERGTTES